MTKSWSIKSASWFVFLSNFIHVIAVVNAAVMVNIAGKRTKVVSILVIK
jgi:hypothetical protein